MKRRHIIAIMLPFAAILCWIGPVPRATARTKLAVASSPPAHATRRPRIDVVFALDTTGSMASLIAGAKQKIWSIINQLADGAPTPIIRVGLIGYRDKGDRYVIKRYALSTNLDQLYTHLMTFRAGGGGDTPEHVNRALYEAVHQMQWSRSRNTLKVIFLVGDAPPKMSYTDDVKYTVTAGVARSRGIIINTVRCGNMGSTARIWGAIARLAGGKYISVQQSGGMVATRTPYDRRLSKLSRELDRTYAFYGPARTRDSAKARQARATRRVTGEVAATRAAVRAKLGVAGMDGVRKDLVSLHARNPQAARAVKVGHLPLAMQRMKPADRRRHLGSLWAKRRTIQRKIVKLSKMRAAYIRREAQKSKRRAARATAAAKRARARYEAAVRSGRLRGAAAARMRAKVRTLARRAAKRRPSISFSDSAVRTLKRQAAPTGVRYK